MCQVVQPLTTLHLFLLLTIVLSVVEVSKADTLHLSRMLPLSSERHRFMYGHLIKSSIQIPPLPLQSSIYLGIMLSLSDRISTFMYLHSSQFAAILAIHYTIQ